MERIKEYIEVTLTTIENNKENPGVVIFGSVVLLGFILWFCKKLKKKGKRIKKVTKYFK